MMFYVTDMYGDQESKMVYGVRKNDSGDTEFLFYRGWDKWVWWDARDYRPVEQDGGAE